MALQALQERIQGEWFAAAVGQVFDVLVEGVSRRRSEELAGRTAGNTVVNFPGPTSWIGNVVPIRILEGGRNSLRGEPVTAEPLSALTGES